MNFRVLSLAVCALALAASTANGQAQVAYAPTPLPGPCPAPLSDTLTGAAGTAACMAQTDATRPTVVQAGNVTTAADGTWSITFAVPFASTTPYVHAEPITPGATLPYDCNVTSRSATGATGVCYQSYSTTLGGTLTALIGSVISPFRPAAGGMTIMVIARPATQ